MSPNDQRLSYLTLLKLLRWNTPTIYNGLEQITRCDTAKVSNNPEEVREFSPHFVHKSDTATEAIDKASE